MLAEERTDLLCGPLATCDEPPAQHETLAESIGEALDDIEDVIEDVFTYDKERHGHAGPFAKTLLLLRNIAAGLAAVLFIVSLFAHISPLRAVAYFFGAIAYLAEILIMTECFKKLASHDELFMAVVFGPLYILMGISYIIN